MSRTRQMFVGCLLLLLLMTAAPADASWARTYRDYLGMEKATMLSDGNWLVSLTGSAGMALVRVDGTSGVPIAARGIPAGLHLFGLVAMGGGEALIWGIHDQGTSPYRDFVGVLTKSMELRSFVDIELEPAHVLVAAVSRRAGGYVLAFRHEDEAELLAVDAAGKIEWHRSYDTSDVNFFQDVAELEDGRILAVGRMARTPWALCVGSQGEVLWQQRFSVRGDLAGVVSLPDGDALITGNVPGDTTTSVFAERVSKGGEIRWQKRGSLAVTSSRSDLLADGRIALGIEGVGVHGILVMDGGGAIGAARQTAGMPGPTSSGMLTTTMKGDGIIVGWLDGGSGTCITSTIPEMSWTVGNFVSTDSDVEVGAVVSQAEAVTIRLPDRPVTSVACAGVATAVATAAPKAAVSTAAPKAVASTVAPKAVASTVAPAPSSAPRAESMVDHYRRVAKEVLGFRHRVQELLKTKSFAELDRIYESARRKRSEVAPGQLMTDMFVETVGEPGLGGEVSDDAHRQLIEQWVADRPSSATARLAQIAFRYHLAWKGRGSGLAGSTKASFEQYEKNLDLAAKARDEAARLAADDPQFLKYAIVIAFERDGVPLAGPAEQAYRRTKADEIVLGVANHLLPMWGGTPAEFHRFAERVAAIEPDGDELYAVLALMACGSCAGQLRDPNKPDSMFTEYGFSIPRVLKGIRSRIAKYPDWLPYRHRLLRIAWLASDRRLARELWSQPGLEWDEVAETVWNSAEYQRAKQWAGVKSPPPVTLEFLKPVLLRNQIGLTRTSKRIDGTNSFLVATKSGPAAIVVVPDARGVYTPSVEGADPIDRGSAPRPPALLDAVGWSWTLTPEKGGGSLKLKQFEMISNPPYVLPGAVASLTALPAFPITVLPVRNSHALATSRATLVRCTQAWPHCGERSVGGSLLPFEGQTMTRFGFMLDKPGDLSGAIGSPVIDADGFVAGVVIDVRNGLAICEHMGLLLRTAAPNFAAPGM